MAVPDLPLSRRLTCVGLAIAIITAPASVAAAQDVEAPLKGRPTIQSPTPPSECGESQACRELALEARERGAYETFHDLAWRAVQTGRPNDPDLMYLVARAQALSGRRRDAAVMLRRLAEAGIPNDAATHEDFRRVRELPEWPYIQTLAARPRPNAPATTAAAAPVKPAAPAVAVAAPAVAVAAPPAPVVPVVKPPTPGVAAATPPAPVVVPSTPPARALLRFDQARVEEAVRFSTPSFVPGGLAYDAVSRRFLFGDVAGRRLFVVGEGSERTLDLVRAESAGFDDVTAIAIDPKRGDLWVASSGAGVGAVHRLQLISGRALTKFAMPGAGARAGAGVDARVGTARLQDIAVIADGAVLILDSAAPRLLVLRRGAPAPEVLLTLTTPAPVGITASDDGRLVYVAHKDGITRVDLGTRRASAVDAKAIALGEFEFIRWHRDAIVGSQRQADGTRGLVRLQLTREGRVATNATLIDRLPSDGGSVAFAAMSGGDLYYLLTGGAEGQPSGSAVMNVRVRRVTLP